MTLTTHRLATKLCIALSLLCCCALVKAQSQCGNATGSICPSQCHLNLNGFVFYSQGPDYGVSGWIACGSNCGMVPANWTSREGGCNINGLARPVIHEVIASANGQQVLMSACGGGFKPLVEKPEDVAQRDWESPGALPILTMR